MERLNKNERSGSTDCSPALKIIAFDCFGTVFDMEGISRDEIRDYVNHVRKNDFTPYKFPLAWRKLAAHPDASEGISILQRNGYKCFALSNGERGLLESISKANNIWWDHIVDLVHHQVYKPHLDAYRTVEKVSGVPPQETLMVTANPSFGDIEGATAIGMPSQVIRQAEGPANIIELAWRLGCGKTVSKALGHTDLMRLVDEGWESWASKPHNKKWVAKIEGTPIKNDLTCNIVRAIQQGS